MKKDRKIFIGRLKKFQNPNNFYDIKANQKQARQKIATGISSQVMDFARKMSEDLGKEEI